MIDEGRIEGDANNGAMGIVGLSEAYGFCKDRMSGDTGRSWELSKKCLICTTGWDSCSGSPSVLPARSIFSLHF